ncbi:hypothetical protein K7640_12065 [Micromonospora sp. PLK6-60]|uniref:hypothetical protein n=1 Tax=Micromonospora sp. PLK6-60 TaxID=2873383 RepID=UPI001CA73D89|nr:hypothetical protein [Micromonospora sp. PLK6-60]MBY8872569.1 hypothetical protein [Micromonospora sp. PLK6-60]
MSGRDDGPLWRRLMLTAACVAAAVVAALARSWPTAVLGLAGAVTGALAVRRMRRVSDPAAGVAPPVPGAPHPRLRGGLILLGSGLVAAVSVVLLTRSGGNRAASLGLGALLAISLYAVGATLLLWGRVFGDRPG